MISILIATHNGAKTLPTVLDAYTKLDHLEDDWQIIIVDNASTDDTPEILRSYTDRLPLLPIRTERQGKNIALNIGLAEVSGSLVVLSDDDAVPAPDWLRQLLCVAKQQSEYDIFGGEITPVWPANLPEWIPRLVNLGATYAITPPGLASGRIEPSQIWGPNMAIRRRVFDAGYRFDENIGPAKGQYVMGSEVEFVCRLERNGYKAWFCNEARVGHMIRQNQIERDWIIKRAYRLGRHMYHQEREEMDTGVALWQGAPRWRYRELVNQYLALFIHKLKKDFDETFKAEWEISFLRGYITEARQSS